MALLSEIGVGQKLNNLIPSARYQELVPNIGVKNKTTPIYDHTHTDVIKGRFVFPARAPPSQGTADMADELVSFSTSSWSEWEGIDLETQGKESPLDDPFESETTGEQADSSSDWASFNDSTFPSPPIPCTSSIDHINVETIFKTCFEVPVDSNKETTTTERTGPLSVETKYMTCNLIKSFSQKYF